MFTKASCDNLNYIYCLPNYKKILFGGNIFKKNFESYLKEKQLDLLGLIKNDNIPSDIVYFYDDIHYL